jgi:starch synthase
VFWWVPGPRVCAWLSALPLALACTACLSAFCCAAYKGAYTLHFSCLTCAWLQVVLLGTGHPHLEAAVAAAQQAHPDFVRAVTTFSEGLAHRIAAGADILLMPSRFEPCGLSQLYALRYGAVPVACATGGLRDTIEDVSPFEDGDAARGTGWTFVPAAAAPLVAVMQRAVGVYRHRPARWRAIQRAGMARDFGWARAAAGYEAVIADALAAGHDS